MDLIGSIKLIENTLGGRYSDHAKYKSAPNNRRHQAVQEKNGNRITINFLHGMKFSPDEILTLQHKQQTTFQKVNENRKRKMG